MKKLAQLSLCFLAQLAALAGSITTLVWDDQPDGPPLTYGVFWAPNGGTGSLPTATPGQSDPDGGTNAVLLTMNKGAGTTTGDYSLLFQGAYSSTTNTVMDYWLKTGDGSTKVIYTRRGGNVQMITNTGTWTKYTNNLTTNDATTINFTLGFRGGYTPASSDSGTLALYHPSVRDTAWGADYVATGDFVPSPAYSGQGAFYFTGDWPFIKTAVFSLVQPVTVIMSFRPLSSTSADTFVDGGDVASSIRLYQSSAYNSWTITAGTDVNDAVSYSPLNTTSVAAVFNGANSWFSIYNRTNSGNAGTTAPNGITIGGVGTPSIPGGSLGNMLWGRTILTSGRTNTVPELTYLRWGSMKQAGVW